MSQPIFLSKRERRLWLAAAAYTLAIYSTLALMRQVTEWLRERNLLRLSLALAAALVLAALVVFLVRRRPSRRQWWALGGVALGYAAVLPLAKAPEEALHLVEYGLLAVLIHAALSERGRHAPAQDNGRQRRRPLRRHPGWTAFALTALAGLVDELIQGWLPSRYYDTRDVIGNAVAGALAIAALAVVEKVRGSDRRAGTPARPAQGPAARDRRAGTPAATATPWPTSSGGTRPPSPPDPLPPPPRG